MLHVKQSIITKYLSLTNHSYSRIKASCERGSMIIEYDQELNEEENHIKAIKKLCKKFAFEDLENYGTPLNKNPWLKKKYYGGLPKSGFVAVFDN